MTRNGDSNGNGQARRRWHQRPAMIPLASALALGITFSGVAYGYGQLADRVLQNAERIDRVEMRIEKRLDAIWRLLNPPQRFSK